jgi:hypothetical protein
LATWSRTEASRSRKLVYVVSTGMAICPFTQAYSIPVRNVKVQVTEC